VFDLTRQSFEGGRFCFFQVGSYAVRWTLETSLGNNSLCFDASGEVSRLGRLFPRQIHGVREFIENARLIENVLAGWPRCPSYIELRGTDGRYRVCTNPDVSTNIWPQISVGTNCRAQPPRSEKQASQTSDSIHRRVAKLADARDSKSGIESGTQCCGLVGVAMTEDGAGCPSIKLESSARQPARPRGLTLLWGCLRNREEERAPTRSSRPVHPPHRTTTCSVIA
jgi:hypothetical protein